MSPADAPFSILFPFFLNPLGVYTPIRPVLFPSSFALSSSSLQLLPPLPKSNAQNLPRLLVPLSRCNGARVVFCKRGLPRSASLDLSKIQVLTCRPLFLSIEECTSCGVVVHLQPNAVSRVPVHAVILWTFPSRFVVRSLPIVFSRTLFGLSLLDERRLSFQLRALRRSFSL